MATLTIFPALGTPLMNLIVLFPGVSILKSFPDTCGTLLIRIIGLLLIFAIFVDVVFKMEFEFVYRPTIF